MKPVLFALLMALTVFAGTAAMTFSMADQATVLAGPQGD